MSGKRRCRILAIVGNVLKIVNVKFYKCPRFGTYANGVDPSLNAASDR